MQVTADGFTRADPGSRFEGARTIRPMLPDDVPAVVQIHCDGFPGFFLTFLGPAFLRLFYDQLLQDPTGIALVATVDSDDIVGFVAGSTDQHTFYRRLAREKKWAFATAALGALGRRPAIAGRLLRALRRPRDSQDASAGACLMSLAVRPSIQTRGIGRKLVEAFCRTVAARGINAICLTTDRDNNDQVNRFYLGQGFRVNRTYVTKENRRMNEYLRLLNEREVDHVQRENSSWLG
jgi:ribosomal protein S18 acetylase RimI-like enzyme